MKKETTLKIIITLLVIVISALITHYNVLPKYKLDIQQDAEYNLAYIQARNRVIFLPFIQAKDNQTMIQPETWKNLCEGLG